MNWVWCVVWIGLLLAPGVRGYGMAAEGASSNAVDDVPVTNEVVEIVDEALPDPREEAYDSIELLTRAILHIRNSYVEEKTYEEIAFGALHGMLRGLDPHSDFLEPKAYDALKEDATGAFGGIGVHIGIRQGLLTVIAPIEDTPAFEAGLQAGDRITQIEGDSTLGMALPDVVELLRGEQGTEVTITISRTGEDEPREVTITRAAIEVPSVKGTRLLDHDIGYVRITQFATPTAGLLREAVDELHGQGMKALVLDLRNNPGGLLRAAIEVAECFVPRGEVIVTIRGRAVEDEEKEARAQGAGRVTDVPIAILVNEGSASASEIVAGCLQDLGRAVLVGERTFGKGSVQSVVQLESGGDAALRLTTAYYYTPSGRLIHDKGIDPDIEDVIEPLEWRRVQVRRAHLESPSVFSEEEIAEYADAKDTQLQRAVDMLQGVVIFGKNGK